MQDSTQIAGSCHCRNIRFVLLWPEPAPVISARKCSCSFCQKHVGAWTSHPRSKLTVKIIDSSSVSKYRFGTKTADFYVCSACGIVPFVLSEIDGFCSEPVRRFSTFAKSAAQPNRRSRTKRRSTRRWRQSQGQVTTC